MPPTSPYPSVAAQSTAACRSLTSKAMLRNPSSLAMAAGEPGTEPGRTKLESSRRVPSPGGVSMTISVRESGMPQTVSKNSPSTNVLPATSRPIATKKAVTTSRSATVRPTWSKRRTCDMGPSSHRRIDRASATVGVLSPSRCETSANAHYPRHADPDAHCRDGRHTHAKLPATPPAVPLLWQVADRLDIVAIRVADECTVIGGVVFRPQPRLVQDSGALRHSGVEEGLHGGAAWCGEGDVGFPEAFTGGLAADPEVRLGWHPVADRVAEVHDTLASQRGKHSVVEGGAGGDVRTLDREMIKHEAYPATTGTPSGLYYASAAGARRLYPAGFTPSGRRVSSHHTLRPHNCAISTVADIGAVVRRSREARYTGRGCRGAWVPPRSGNSRG